MGLSEEDKKSHWYFKQLKAKEEIERLNRAKKSPEYVQELQKFRFAFEDHLYQRIVAYFKAIKEESPTVELVVGCTYYYVEMVCGDILHNRPLLAEKMLIEFGLVKKRKEHSI